MEIYSNTTRFALACNYSEKVIEAIQSRCAILRYSRLSDEQVLARTIQICQKENVPNLILPVLELLTSSTFRWNTQRMVWKP